MRIVSQVNGLHPNYIASVFIYILYFLKKYVFNNGIFSLENNVHYYFVLYRNF